ncbi:hypothetical protein [Spiroplasma endosymbiont of Cantharis nigra]|uniref:hypothetical protein n=1 Tax=Spiroplasma endosymbiont of Cantharis nigra TaxID=3066278 RepID=UPI0030D481E3
MKNFIIYKFQFKNIIRNKTLIIFSSITFVLTAFFSLLIVIASPTVNNFYTRSFGLYFTFKMIIQIICIGIFEAFLVYFLFYKQFNDGLVKIEIRAKIKYRNIFLQRLLLNKSLSSLFISTMFILDLLIASFRIKSADQLIINKLLYAYLFIILFDLFINFFVLLILSISNIPVFFTLIMFTTLVTSFSSLIDSIGYMKTIDINDKHNVGKSDLAMSYSISNFEDKYVYDFYKVTNNSNLLDEFYEQYIYYINQEKFNSEKGFIYLQFNDAFKPPKIVETINKLFENDSTYKITENDSKEINFLPSQNINKFKFTYFYKFKLDKSLTKLYELANQSNNEDAILYLPIFKYLADIEYPTMKSMMISAPQSSKITSPFIKEDNNIIAWNSGLFKDTIKYFNNNFAAYLCSYIVLNYMRTMFSISYDLIYSDYELKNVIPSQIRSNLYFNPLSHVSSMLAGKGKNKFITDKVNVFSNPLNFNFVNTTKELQYEENSNHYLSNILIDKELKQNEIQYKPDFIENTKYKTYFQLIKSLKFKSILYIWVLFLFYFILGIIFLLLSFLFMKKRIYI